MRRWLTVTIGGQEWGVYLASRRSKYLRGRERYVGRAVYEQCRIYILSTAPDGVREDTLLHELLHVMLHVSGADKAYGGDVEADEAIVTAVAPYLHRLVKDLGFTFPTPPSR
jgi:hypothetical protein